MSGISYAPSSPSPLDLDSGVPPRPKTPSPKWKLTTQQGKKPQSSRSKVKKEVSEQSEVKALAANVTPLVERYGKGSAAQHKKLLSNLFRTIPGEVHQSNLPTEGSPMKRQRVETSDPQKFEKLIQEKKDLLHETPLTPQVIDRLEQISKELTGITSTVVSTASRSADKRIPKCRQSALEKHRQYLANIKNLPPTDVFGKTRLRDAEIARVEKMIVNLEVKLGLRSK